MEESLLTRRHRGQTALVVHATNALDAHDDQLLMEIFDLLGNVGVILTTFSAQHRSAVLRVWRKRQLDAGLSHTIPNYVAKSIRFSEKQERHLAAGVAAGSPVSTAPVQHDASSWFTRLLGLLFGRRKAQVA